MKTLIVSALLLSAAGLANSRADVSVGISIGDHRARARAYDSATIRHGGPYVVPRAPVIVRDTCERESHREYARHDVPRHHIPRRDVHRESDRSGHRR